MRATLILTAIALIGGAASTIAQTSHVHGTKHTSHDQAPVDAVLTEPGQGAFAALSEVVRVLEADPTTDWSRVDLTGLRAHLIDMDRLVTDAIVTQSSLPNGIIASATGDATTVAALRRMVPAHAAQLALDERWSVEAKNTDTGVDLHVTSDNPAVVARIRGLGFFGLMASQDHHRAHHLKMARGEDVHGH
ncbi:hypothetical protein [uncultured Tateyamaria sp.]|uniref:hypothetical protein n=1 Tax=uncultured Tateyamaria sp. TaxID=455651 RepID=UPI00260AEAA3|nr:hypothetical protein [uncultured Tateyamaria sp.]